MKRICIICGARVRNKNTKTKTCDSICTFAKEKGLDRNAAAHQLAIFQAEEREYWDSILPKKTHDH